MEFDGRTEDIRIRVLEMVNNQLAGKGDGKRRLLGSVTMAARQTANFSPMTPVPPFNEELSY